MAFAAPPLYIRPAHSLANHRCWSRFVPKAAKLRLRACAPSQSSPHPHPPVASDETNPPQPFLLPPSTIAKAVRGTMLQHCQLAQVYSSELHGFSNDAFFDQQLPLEGVPSLLLGQTEDGKLFGGYTAFGFLARDDYREATTEKAMFVFSVHADELLIAHPTDLVQYDFYDYAVRLGAGLLCMPMNPAKHIMKPNAATSSCRMPDGTTSVFGQFSMAKVKHLQVLVAKKYVDELDKSKQQSKSGFFSRFFA